MFEQEIKKIYDTITPSDEIRAALLIKICRIRKRKARFILAVEFFASAAACFLLAIIINFTGFSGSAIITDKWIGSVMSDPSVYLIVVMLFIILITTFVIIYRNNISRHIDRQHKDKHE